MRDGRNRKLSIAFYFALALLGAQFAANAWKDVPFNYAFLAITGSIVLGILFGPSFPIDLFRALRGQPRERDDGVDGDDA